MFVLTGVTNAQKSSCQKALKHVYGKKGLNSFRETYGSLDLLNYAYDHGINELVNNGQKSLDEFPMAGITNHFTDLNVIIQPYTQYFRTDNPNKLIAVKSLYQLQLEYNEYIKNKH